MGSCSLKIANEPKNSPKVIKIRPYMTPITSGSTNPLHFPLDPRPETIFSEHFKAFGRFPNTFEDPFTEKSTKFKGIPAFEPFTKSKIAVSCTKGQKTSPNQDNFCIISSLSGIIIGVFDGHGDNGHKISSLARKIVVNKIEELGFSSISHAFFSTNKEILNKCTAKNVDCQFSGSTAAVATIFSNTLTVAHLGDSRVLLIKSYENQLISVPLTIDHKPSDLVEQHRIENSGGIIMKKSQEDVLRVYSPNSPLGLALTRSFGDLAFESVGVICKPDVKKIALEANDRFLVMGTDGVWDFVENYEVAAVLEEFDCRNACEKISKLARERWIGSGVEGVDDITIVILPIGVS